MTEDWRQSVRARCNPSYRRSILHASARRFLVIGDALLQLPSGGALGMIPLSA
jgi:hypothetical protein